jgi:CRISPR/Cas system-associated exonuclease Cas4 (RecB family)
MNDKINQIIDQHLANKPQHARHPHTYYPSSASTCLRKQYYNQKHPTEHEPKTLRIFEAGNIIHDWITRVLTASPLVELLCEERSFTLTIPDTEAVIHGRLDNMIRLKGEEEDIIVDVKSTKTLDFVQDEPQPDHVNQVMLYLKAFRVKKGAILYVEKNTLATKTHEFEFDSAVYDKLIDSVKRLDNMILEDVLPPKTTDQSQKWKCRFCSYTGKCRKDEV